jgi:hypothetical protein
MSKRPNVWLRPCRACGKLDRGFWTNERSKFTLGICQECEYKAQFERY